jgi:hypothetical protein
MVNFAADLQARREAGEAKKSRRRKKKDDQDMFEAEPEEDRLDEPEDDGLEESDGGNVSQDEFSLVDDN